MVSLLCFCYCLFDVSLVAGAHKLTVLFSDHRPKGSQSENPLHKSRDAATVLCFCKKKHLHPHFVFKVKSLVRLVHIFTNLFIFFSKNIYSSAAAFGGETPLRAGIL